MKRDLVRRVGGMLLAGVAVLVLLSACGGSSPAAPAPAPTAARSAPEASLASQGSTSASASTAGAPAPASSLRANKGGGDLLEQGKLIFEKTAGGVGCASCHGLDGKGTTKVGAPDIRGASETRVRGALAGGVAMMSFIKSTDAEITAVVAYLQELSK